MGVTGCVSCAGSTAAPTVLLTRDWPWSVIECSLVVRSETPRHFDELVETSSAL